METEQAQSVRIAGVRFKKASKVYDFDSGALELTPGDTVIVEVEKGLGLGLVAYAPREIDASVYPRRLKKVIRKADQVDLDRNTFNTEREEEAMRICREKIAEYKLPMKLIRVEYLFDSSKAIFYFTSEIRVDFRDLVKDLAARFHTRIEMRQIGVRDEAKMLGGLGPCGRMLCCSSFLSDFAPVTIRMAKEQNLALNPAKISGICGRLMCCLGYEHGMYKEHGCPKKQAPEAVVAEGAPGEGGAPQEAGAAAEGATAAEGAAVPVPPIGIQQGSPGGAPSFRGRRGDRPGDRRGGRPGDRSGGGKPGERSGDRQGRKESNRQGPIQQRAGQGGRQGAPEEGQRQEAAQGGGQGTQRGASVEGQPQGGAAAAGSEREGRERGRRRNRGRNRGRNRNRGPGGQGGQQGGSGGQGGQGGSAPPEGTP